MPPFFEDTMEFHPFDLHMHSIYSDGTDSPRALVGRAANAGMRMIALSDHDTLAGVPEALAAGAELGLTVLPSVEFDCEWPSELHILGVGVQPAHAALQTAMETSRARRGERNRHIEAQLAQAGMDILPHMPETPGARTRLHYAVALVAGGYAKSKSDAFTRILGRGGAGYYVVPRFTPQEVVECIHAAGGLAVLAHPCHYRGNIHALVHMLAAHGLGGIEAYYPHTDEGQKALFQSLAAQYGQLLTCGSDCHGKNRPDVDIGCAYTPVPELEKTYRLLLARN